MPTRLTQASVIVACAIALTACSESGNPVPSGDPGPSTPGSTGLPTTTAQDNRYGAPRVESPLDAAKQVADPCTSLNPDQLRPLDMAETPRPGDKAEFDSLGPYCAWPDTADRALFTVGYLVPNENGLADLYRGNENGDWEYWEPTTVNGYPGVWQSGVDLRDSGACTISVGITEELTFSVFSQGGEPNSACDQVKEIAGAVIDTLKNGG